MPFLPIYELGFFTNAHADSTPNAHPADTP